MLYPVAPLLRALALAPASPPRPATLRRQLSMYFALLALVLALALAGALGSMLIERERDDAQSALDDMARVVGRQLVQDMAERTREVRAMAESPTLWRDGLGAERVRQVLQRSQAIHPQSAWIGVADAHGIVQAATGDLLLRADVGQRPWFIAAKQGVFVGDVHPAKLLATKLPPARDGGAQRFVDFAAPIVRDGRLLGVVGIHGSWDWAHDVVAALIPATASHRGIEIFIFDKEGLPIYAPGFSLAGHLASGQRLPAGTGRIATWADGQAYLTAASALSSTGETAALGWTVVARQPVRQAYAAAYASSRQTLTVGLVGAAVAALVGLALARRLAAPLRRLADEAMRVQAMPAGAVLHELHEGSAEIEQLSGALAGMTQRLQQANADLEQRVRDRTAALERANAELAALAHHDPLTGLLNRRGFEARADMARASALRRGTPLALLAIDVDHFKSINDRFGHDGGDDVLRHLARMLRERLRETDLVARLGGEEFVALLPDTDIDAAAGVARSLVLRIASTPVPGVGRVTVSAGVAPWPPGEATLRQALARADEALYEAKGAGRNCACMARAPHGAIELVADVPAGAPAG